MSQSTFHADADYKPGLIRGYGMPWAEKKLIEIPLASMSAKILCVHHNNALTDLDSEVGRLASTFLEIIEFVVFEYFGINYLLPLTDQPMPDKLMDLSHNPTNYPPLDEYIARIQKAPILVHPKGVNFQCGMRRRVEVTFSW